MYPARPPAGFAGAYTSHVTHGNAILVNSNQRGNPILKYLRNVNHRFADIVPDFQFNDKVPSPPQVPTATCLATPRSTPTTTTPPGPRMPAWPYKHTCVSCCVLRAACPCPSTSRHCHRAAMVWGLSQHAHVRLVAPASDTAVALTSVCPHTIQHVPHPTEPATRRHGTTADISIPHMITPLLRMPRTRPAHAPRTMGSNPPHPPARRVLRAVQTAAVFLSLKFHRLRPQYMHERIKALNRAFRTFLLCHCDVEDPINPLAEVSQGAVDANVTLIVAFSDMEAARYLELLKAYENKAADALKPQAETDYVARCAATAAAARLPLGS